MKTKRLLLIFLVVGLGICLASTDLFAKKKTGTGTKAKPDPARARILAEAGKTYTGFQDPEFLSYDEALREYLARKINRQYGVSLDPKSYTGFELLEIEALLKCKKSNETLDGLLGHLPKR